MGSNVTVNALLGNYFWGVLGQATTLALSNMADGALLEIVITNTSSNWTLGWPAGIKWPGGVTPVMSIGAHTDVYTLIQVNGTIYGNAVQNF